MQERGGSFTGFAFRNANSFSVFHLEPVECYGPFQAMKTRDKDLTVFLEGGVHDFHLSCFSWCLRRDLARHLCDYCVKSSVPG